MKGNSNYFRGAKKAVKTRKINKSIVEEQNKALAAGRLTVTLSLVGRKITVPSFAVVKVHSDKSIEIN